MTRGRLRCECCSRRLRRQDARRDSEGVPLCRSCYAALLAETMRSPCECEVCGHEAPPEAWGGDPKRTPWADRTCPACGSRAGVMDETGGGN